MKTYLHAFHSILASALFLALIMPASLYSRSNTEVREQNHEITIFVIPSLVPIDWSNPSVLLKSLEGCFVKALFQKNPYIIGHTIARINSPLLPEPYFVAMSGTVPAEKAELVIIKKVGLGALGSTIQGHMEQERNIKKGMELYSKRKMIAFIKFKVNEYSLIRILQFINQYRNRTNFNFASCDFYNGSTWPRYQNEGSGCSAFGLSLLDVANILPPASSKWRVDIKIPINLIGGEFNNNRKIKLSTIRRTKTWFNGLGVLDVDYVKHSIYDPSMIYNWILDERKLGSADFKVDEENGIPGLVVDRCNVVVDASEPIFQVRTDSNLFVKHYYQKIRNFVIN